MVLYYATNELGGPITSPSTGADNQFVDHPSKNLPLNYSVANWVIDKARRDFENPAVGDSFLTDQSLSAYTRFKFNRGREGPYSVVVNNRTRCVQGSTYDKTFCTQCTPHAYDARSYAPYITPQPNGEPVDSAPLPFLAQPLTSNPPYGGSYKYYAESL